MGNRSCGKLHMVHETVFFQDKMIGRKDRDNSFRAPLIDVHEREEDAGPRLLILGLHYHVLRRTAGKLGRTAP